MRLGLETYKQGKHLSTVCVCVCVCIPWCELCLPQRCRGLRHGRMQRREVTRMQTRHHTPPTTTHPFTHMRITPLPLAILHPIVYRITVRFLAAITGGRIVMLCVMVMCAMLVSVRVYVLAVCGESVSVVPTQPALQGALGAVGRMPSVPRSLPPSDSPSASSTTPCMCMVIIRFFVTALMV